LRDLDVWGQPSFWTYAAAFHRCERCHHRQDLIPPFKRKDASYTYRFEQHVVRLMIGSTEEEVARLEETSAMTMEIPELRARSVDELSRTIDVIAEATARRIGRDPGDFAVRNLVGAIIGVILSATMPWAPGHHTADTFARVDAALAHLEAGLPL